MLWVPTVGVPSSLTEADSGASQPSQVLTGPGLIQRNSVQRAPHVINFNIIRLIFLEYLKWGPPVGLTLN